MTSARTGSAITMLRDAEAEDERGLDDVGIERALQGLDPAGTDAQREVARDVDAEIGHRLHQRAALGVDAAAAGRADQRLGADMHARAQMRLRTDAEQSDRVATGAAAPAAVGLPGEVDRRREEAA